MPTYKYCSAPADRHDGQRGRALYLPRRARHRKHRRHQPELRLGPGLLDRLRGRDEGPQARTSRSTTSQMPKLFAGQYGAEISALLASGADVVHSSFWGGDLEAFVLQAAPRGVFKKSKVVLTAGETAIAASARRSPTARSSARADRSACSRPTRAQRLVPHGLSDRYGGCPELSLVQDGPGDPGREGRLREGARAGRQDAEPGPGDRRVRGPDLRGPSGTVKMALGKGHQAIQDARTARRRPSAAS